MSHTAPPAVLTDLSMTRRGDSASQPVGPVLAVVHAVAKLTASTEKIKLLKE